MLSIMDDELDIDTAQTKEDKEYATRSKASKTWRILRLSAKSKLAAFEKIEDGKNLKILFETAQQPDGTPQALEGTPQASEKPLAEDESTGPGQDRTVANTENESSPVATEHNPADSKDAAAPDTKTM